MGSRNPSASKSAGFTLIELVVVLAMIAIATTMAAPSFQRAMARQGLSTIASDLLASAMQARSEAIKDNQQTIVQPLVGNDWSQGWRIYVDTNKDKTYTAAIDRLITNLHPTVDNLNVAEAAMNPAVGNLIGFDASGFLIGRNAGRVVFSSRSIPGSELKKGVKISVTGRVRICTSQPGNDGCGDN